MLWLAASLAAASPPPAAGEASAPPRSLRVLPFAQQIDVDAVRSVVASPPSALVAAIRRHGVDVLVVSTDGHVVAPNRLLADLPRATSEQLRHAEFQPGYEGRLVPWSSQCPGIERDTILVRDTASAWTLIHEFVHALLLPLPGCVEHVDLEWRFVLALHRLEVYQRRLYADPNRLLDAQWRRDILEAQGEVVALLFDRIRIGQSQEAIVEKLLGDLLDERSPYFDALRRERGHLYGQAMIDNAIDVFGVVHGSLAHTLQTVRDLRAQRRDDAADATAAPADGWLSEDDALAFEAASQAIASRLDRVRTELHALKRFYVEEQRW